MNCNIPVIEVLVRLDYMNQLDPAYAETFAPGLIFGVASIPGQTPLFHVLCDDGGVYWRLPISALCWKECEHKPLVDLALWDSFSYRIDCTVFDLLKNKRVTYRDRMKQSHLGVYLFTLDWFGDDGASYGFSETPGQHKAGHVIKLDTGHFAIQPNNQIQIHDPNWVVSKAVYPRKLSKHLYSSEQSNRWKTEDSDSYNYEITT